MDQKSPHTLSQELPPSTLCNLTHNHHQKSLTMDQKSTHTPSQEPPLFIQPLPKNSSPPAGGSAKIATPDRLTVPKAFKYQEMYKSPTDQIMSPVSKGLLARTRSMKSSPLLPSLYARNQQHKIQASKFQDLAALKT